MSSLDRILRLAQEHPEINGEVTHRLQKHLLDSLKKLNLGQIFALYSFVNKNQHLPPRDAESQIYHKLGDHFLPPSKSEIVSYIKALPLVRGVPKLPTQLPAPNWGLELDIRKLLQDAQKLSNGQAILAWTLARKGLVHIPLNMGTKGLVKRILFLKIKYERSNKNPQVYAPLLRYREAVNLVKRFRLPF